MLLLALATSSGHSAAVISFSENPLGDARSRLLTCTLQPGALELGDTGDPATSALDPWAGESRTAAVSSSQINPDSPRWHLDIVHDADDRLAIVIDAHGAGHWLLTPAGIAGSCYLAPTDDRKSGRA